MRRVWTVSLMVISVFLGVSGWFVLAEERTVKTIDGSKTLEFKVGKDGKEMVWIPGGTFQMGDRWRDGRPDERPVHSVTVNGFWMDTTEVTNAEFRRFIEATESEVEGSWKYDPDEPNYPAQYVSWNDAVAYAKWADKRLPTEAEWECAAGGPNHHKYSLGNTLDLNNYSGSKTRSTKPEPVASHPANGYGLYDMSGNVWEWCNDWYDKDYYSKSPSNNPQGPIDGQERVLRSGNWGHVPSSCLRVPLRQGFSPDGMFDLLGFGFRCVSNE